MALEKKLFTGVHDTAENYNKRRTKELKVEGKLIVSSTVRKIQKLLWY